MKKMLIILAALMLLAGCNDSTPEPSQAPVYNSPRVSAGVSPAPDTTPSENAAPDVSDTGDSEAANFKAAVYFTDFQGVTITEKRPESANSAFTNFFQYNKVYVLTYDEETSTVYYANYSDSTYGVGNGDNYIYSYRDGERELLVELPANYLNYKDGVIYFLSNENVGDLYGFSNSSYHYPCGKIYAYNTVDKSLSLLLDENVGELSVTGDYLYFRKTTARDGTDAEAQYSRMKIGDSTAENMGDYLPFFYGEYQLRFAEPEQDSALCALELVSGETVVKLADAGFYNSGFSGAEFCIAGDTFWFMGKFDGKQCIASINLTNGEQKVYPWGPATFAVTDEGRFFAISNNNIQVYNDDAEEFEQIQYAFPRKSAYFAVYYVDGEIYLVALESNMGHSGTVILKLVPIDESQNWYDAEEINR